MPSLIEGFEYDVFISYRQNDNRSGASAGSGQGWVTEFVHQLQEELAATIKEPLSIYFDKNPHDGLLETHSVDKSLEGKLKCLIFIPIISQTYCDTKSFAWEHEFCAFNKQAKEDQFGMDIKLSNGNVASRILPIKIHDLDPEDKSTIEKELGSVLRAIEFIYKEPGVNRPLKSTDTKADNQNKTDYQNQVNKVANAIKEIVGSLRNPSQPPQTPAGGHPTATATGTKKVVIGIGVVLLLAISLFLYQRTSSPPEPPHDKSIAVLPFADLSKEHDLEYLGDGVAEEIINVLAQTQGLKVIARSSSFQFKGKNEDLREMGRKLGVSTILEGSVRKFQDQIRVTAQLINVEDGSHYWSKNMDQKTQNLFEIQDAIAREVASTLKATLFEGASSKQKVEWNEEALKLYQKGRFFFDRSADGDTERAAEFLQKSVDLDSSQAISMVCLAYNYAAMKKFKELEYWTERAARADSTLPEYHALRSIQYTRKLEFRNAFNELSSALVKGKANPFVLRASTGICLLAGQTKKAVELARLAVETDPLIGRSHLILFWALAQDHNYPEVLKSSQKAVEIFPEVEIHRSLLATALAMNNQFDSALAEVRQIKNNNYVFDVLLYTYFRQGNFNKLDSMYITIPPDQQTIGTQIAHLLVQHKQEQATDLLVHATMDVYLLGEMQTNPIFSLLSADARFQDLLKKYSYDGQLPSLN